VWRHVRASYCVAFTVGLLTVAYLCRARLIRWCQLRLSGHVDDATALLPRREASGLVTMTLWTAAHAHNSRPLLNEACIQYKSSKTACDLYASQ